MEGFFAMRGFDGAIARRFNAGEAGEIFCAWNGAAIGQRNRKMQNEPICSRLSIATYVAIES